VPTPVAEAMDLPEHLAERCRWVSQHRTPVGDGPVVVWLKSLFRVHENPVVDVARWMAHHHDRPLLIYHGLDERYPHASLRHHNVVIDAAVDLHRGFTKQGLRYVFHLAREDHRPAAMKRLAQQASMVVTDLFPLPPWDEWVRRVTEGTGAAVVEVDGHCVIPMPLFGKSVDRPFKFRDATKKLRKRRLQRSWPMLDLDVRPYDGHLPFEPVMVEHQLADVDARWALLKQCNIDPTVHPIWRFRGGEQAALARWQAFKEKGLNGYARRRNNAADTDGVSRMSAYIHYGMISPMKIAREAAEVGTKSAEKYLDELLVFREHPWHHIFAVDDPYSTHHLPEWARQSWRGTADDPRTTQYSLRQLERGEVHDPLWAACQRSLLRQGELHNNVRMTWGKALPFWTETMAQSMAYGQALNDKYALDGRDPSSVVGVQWCHGLFDRPFVPPTPVLGTVRQRDPRTHMTRLDMDAYRRFTDQPAATTDHPIVVVGAGLAGAVAARLLADHGFDVFVMDKGRRVGGRCSRRRVDEVVVNHGASRLDGWPSWMEAWIDQAVDLGWMERSEEGVLLKDGPTVIGHWLDGIEVLTGTTVVRVERQGEVWVIDDESGHQWTASGVVLTAPLPQLHRFLPQAPDEWSTHAYEPTWTVVAAHTEPAPSHLEHLLSTEGYAVETGDDVRGLVVHLPRQWSQEHLENDSTDIVQAWLSKVHDLDDEGFAWMKTATLQAHRWRYGRSTNAGVGVHLPHLVVAGDAWSEPAGTGGAALHSGAWAAANLAWQLGHHRRPEAAPIQQTLF
jgi:deoxyribodipyrimidine photo-lyase